MSGIYLHLLYHKKSTIHIGKYTIVPLIRDGYSDIGIITCDSGQKNQKNFRYRNFFHLEPRICSFLPWWDNEMLVFLEGICSSTKMFNDQPPAL